MTTFERTDELAGARLIDCDLSGVVMRGVQVDDVDIDAPWLLDGDGSLRVNGVDVRPYVEAELRRRFPGRALMTATEPRTLRVAWAAAETAWADVVDRAAAMPAGTVDVSVDGEWSLAQTLRHLVLATDLWFGRAVLGLERPFHPVGLPHTGAEEEGFDPSVLATEPPSYQEVLAARADRGAQVRGFLAAVTPEELLAPRRNPWNPGFPETTLSCLHTVLHEEWEHLRYAVRDLDAIDGGEVSA